MKIKHLIIASIIMLASCSSGTISKDYTKFENLQWQQKDIKTLTIDIPSDTITADLLLDVRYAQGFPYKFLNIAIEETAPDGTVSTIPYTCQLRSDDGKYLGDGSGDIWDASFTIKKNTKLQKGKYTYKLGHAMEQETAVLLMEIGIKATRSSN